MKVQLLAMLVDGVLHCRFIYLCCFCEYFNLTRLSSGIYFYIIAELLGFFLVNFLKTWLHNVILVRCGHFCLVNYSAPFGHPLVGWNFRLLHHVTFLLLCVYQLPQICYQVLVQSNLWYLWVLEAVSIFWFSRVWHCFLIGGYHYFGGTYYIHFHIDSSLITQKTSIFSAWKLHILWSVLFLIL